MNTFIERMKDSVIQAIDAEQELTRILSREISKQIARSFFDDCIINNTKIDSTIDINMHAYGLCIGGNDNDGAIEALDRVIKIQMLNIKNKHCE